MKEDIRTSWESAVITIILMIIVLGVAFLGFTIFIKLALAQTRPVWPLPQCDDVKPAGTFACILVSEEHWGGNLPRPAVVFTCLKIDNVLQNCWLGDQ